jgi:hypothetical protein
MLYCALSAHGAAAALADEKAHAAQGPVAAQTPVSALAAAPWPRARALAITEAMLEYCAKNDASEVEKVHGRFERLVKGADRDTLDAARRSAEYRTAYESEVEFIGKVDPHNAKRVCSEPLAQEK